MLTSAELLRLLCALALLVVVAHGVGLAFARLRQPPVIGEIVGGLLLGPTLLGLVAPGAEGWLFPTTGAGGAVLSAMSQLGLLLLMFCSGLEMRAVFRADDRRLVAAVTAVGMLVPFALGLGVTRLVDTHRFAGPAGDPTALAVVFALAIAVTSIPVISRIMFDVGILHTRFARTVLAVAVVEDTVVYVVLALVLGRASGSSPAGAAALLDLAPGSAGDLGFHVAATIVVLAGLLTLGPPLLHRLDRSGDAASWGSTEIAHDLVLLLGACAGSAALGVTPMLGAFVAGVAASSTRGRGAAAARGGLKDFSFAFFIPVYFALVGVRLDLAHHFDAVFFLWFLALATVAKTASVYAGARLGGEPRAGAWNLGVAMNARGGPGIVLATVTYAAGVIDQEFYAALVLLAIVTSLAAGSWLGRLVRVGRFADAGAPARGSAIPAPEQRAPNPATS